MLTGSRLPRTLALAAVLGVTLAACALPGQQGNAPAALPTAATDGNIPGASYPAPGTPTTAAGSPTALAPTAVAPTAAPPTAIPPTAGVPGAATLLGPEWTVLFSGDLNGNGVPDAVGWLQGGTRPGPSFSRPPYNTYVGAANNLVIVEANREGRPVVRLSVAPERINADGVPLVTFAADRRPAAFMVQLNPRGPVLMDILQVNTGGEPFAQGIGVRWNAQAQAYRISASGGK